MALEKSSLVDLKGLNEVYKTLTAQYEALLGVVGSALGVMDTSGTVLNTDPNADLNVTRPINIGNANIADATLGELTATGDVTLGSGSSGANPTKVNIKSYTEIEGNLKVNEIDASGISVSSKDPLKVKATSVPAGDGDTIYLLGVKDTRDVDITYTVDVANGPKVYMDSSGTLTATDITITSSRKAKENIQSTHVKGTDIVDSINVVDFTYINDPDKVPHVGFIAEDTDSLLSTPGRNKMDYTNCIGILLKAVQELSARVKELEASR